MISKTEMIGTPMANALEALANELWSMDMPPITLNVIGGFAMMLHGLRSPSGTTDIDYIGKKLPQDVLTIADRIGLQYGMGKGWINNDAMLAGISMEDFEFSTGKLHFTPVFQMGPIQVNVLCEEDLLRLKLIAVDTAMAGVSAGDSFTREKDLPDIAALLDRSPKSICETLQESAGYIGYGTAKLVKVYLSGGMEAVYHRLDMLKVHRPVTEKPNKEYLKDVLSTAYAEARRRDTL